MTDRPPPAKPGEQTPFEKFKDLAQRLLAVDKKDIPKPRRTKRKDRRKTDS
jgi:hypothetical protein